MFIHKFTTGTDFRNIGKTATACKGCDYHTSHCRCR